MKYKVIIRPGDISGYVVECPAIPESRLGYKSYWLSEDICLIINGILFFKGFNEGEKL